MENNNETVVAETALQVKRKDIYAIPFSLLRIRENFNIRQDYGDIEELANSIRENGVVMPLKGYKSKEEGAEVYIVVDGHRRFKACEALYQSGLEISVPFILENKGTNDEQRVLDMFITNEGKPLTMLEQAEGVRRLLAFGYNASQIAKRLGKTATHIGNLNTLLSAPRELINHVEEGIISPTEAIKAVRKENVSELLALAKEIKEGPQEGAANPFDDGNEDYEPNGAKLFLQNGQERGEEAQDSEPDADAGTEEVVKEFPDKKLAKPKTKVTAKDLAPALKSFQELKKYVGAANTDNFTDFQIKFYELLDKIANNQATERQIRLFMTSLGKYEFQD